MKRIILASASPRRRALLTELGWDFTAETSGFEETARQGEAPRDMVLRFALGKALDAAVRHKNETVVAADTTVVIDGIALGKPKDEAEAFEMLKTLQGRTHEVLTAVAVVTGQNAPRTAVESTKVTFRHLSDAQIKAYIATGESLDKAGAYAIQGHGMLLVEKIDGCYFNVVGLPVALLSKMLEQTDFTLTEQWGS